MTLSYLKDSIHDKICQYGIQPLVSTTGLRNIGTGLANADGTIPSTKERTNLSTSVLECTPLETDGRGSFLDPKTGRKVVLKGINVDAAMKYPTQPQDLPSHKGNSLDPDNFFFTTADEVSFVGRPFPLEEAEMHFQRIKSWGYNTIRYLITWEAIEHEGPGKYDEDFLDYTIKMLRILHKVGGLYVFLEFHQDVWSRFSGGSGAPIWTLYAAGLQPKRFAVTEAALLHNDEKYRNPENPEGYQKMIWTTNYKRLASLVMFTFFFAGDDYFPQCKINGQNIRDYLQSHFLAATELIWSRVTKELPKMIEDGTLLGFELMNEPNCGLVGHPSLGEIPDFQQLRVGTTPTVFQTFKLGMGLPCDVDVYRITLTGPQKHAVKCVDPKGARAWMSTDEAAIIDKHYGWQRDPLWIIGECIFAQNKIWSYDKIQFDKLEGKSQSLRLSIANRNCRLLQPNYFHKPLPNAPAGDAKIVDHHFFMNNQFIRYYIAHKQIIRKIVPLAFVLMQPPVLEIPPDLKKDTRGIVDLKTIYCPHYYDGISIMYKTWNSKYNVDTLGIMRGKYLNPVLGIVFGERAIRNCIRKQFLDIREECRSLLGDIPVLMSETGMPFDMDNKYAYETGRYTSQTAALDALSYALEGLGMSHTFWCYSNANCHKWGDRWNQEDFSFWSPEDRNEDASILDDASTRRMLLTSIKASVRKKNKKLGLRRPRSRGSSGSTKSNGSGSGSESSSKEDVTGTDDDLFSIQSTIIESTTLNVQVDHHKRCYPSPDGVRAVSAVVRPFVLATRGDIENSYFDLKNVTYNLVLKIEKNDTNSSPTVIFVPKWHYPYLNANDVFISSGTVQYNEKLEYIEWYPDTKFDRLQTIVIKNSSGSLERELDEGTNRISQESNCPIT